MGFKNDVSTALAELSGRVEALEELASNHLGFVPSTRVYRDTEVTAARTENTTTRTGEGAEIDFGAIAFGLSELRRQARNAGVSGAEGIISGAVDYFADVFAKANPKGFDRATFVAASRR